MAFGELTLQSIEATWIINFYICDLLSFKNELTMNDQATVSTILGIYLTSQSIGWSVY